MRYKYFQNGQAGLSGLYVVDMLSFNKSWKGAYMAFKPWGIRVPVGKEGLKKLIEITKEEYLKKTFGFYTPEKFLL